MGKIRKRKNRQLLEEEIYTTIISIFKKQQQEIDEISSTLDKLNKYFDDLRNVV